MEMCTYPRLPPLAPGVRAVPFWPSAQFLGIVRLNFRPPRCGRRGDSVDDLQIAWLIVGWLLAFWAGKDLQARFTQWRSARRDE